MDITNSFTRAGVLVLEHYSSTIFWVLVLETFGTRKILVLVRLCTRYSFEKAIEYTSTLSNGKASCRSALKCQWNFVPPRVLSKYVTTSVRSSFIVQIQVFNFLRWRTSANCYWSHTVTHFQTCVHEDLSEYLKAQHSQHLIAHLIAQHLALLDSQIVA